MPIGKTKAAYQANLTERNTVMTTTFKPVLYVQMYTIFMILMLGPMGSVEARDNWQEQMLFNPSVNQLKLEKHGRIIIYDGLKDTQITQAMDTQFDRVQSMMFIRTVATDSEGETLRDEKTGEEVVEDDGC